MSARGTRCGGFAAAAAAAATAAAAVVAFATSGAVAQSARVSPAPFASDAIGDGTPPAARTLAPAVVLARYAHALATLREPRTLAFEYAVEQVGARDLEQRHQVYRSGARERDELLAADGVTLKRPSVRIFAHRVSHYDVARLAPVPGRYAFVFAGVVRSKAGDRYAFTTRARASAGFAVTGVTIDGTRFLPSAIRFRIAGRGARGTGEVRYAPYEGHWLVTSAAVRATGASHEVQRETIAWTGYTFPTALPPSTFEVPHAAAPAVPPPAGGLAEPGDPAGSPAAPPAADGADAGVPPAAADAAGASGAAGAPSGGGPAAGGATQPVTPR